MSDSVTPALNGTRDYGVQMCGAQYSLVLQRSVKNPRACEDLLRNVYNFFFVHSAIRTSELKEFQVFCEVKPHKLLHVSAMRWLSLHDAVARLIEQCNAIKLFPRQSN